MRTSAQRRCTLNKNVRLVWNTPQKHNPKHTQGTYLQKLWYVSRSIPELHPWNILRIIPLKHTLDKNAERDGSFWQILCSYICTSMCVPTSIVYVRTRILFLLYLLCLLLCPQHACSWAVPHCKPHNHSFGSSTVLLIITDGYWWTNHPTSIGSSFLSQAHPTTGSYTLGT